MKKPDKYAKRPEFIDVDNATKTPAHYKGEYVKNLPGLGNIYSQVVVAASYSGKMGGLPRQAMALMGGPVGDAVPVERRNRKAPNPLEEHQ